eukprot:CAMPEP_0175311230 /NCGR_PEP_ID=MMETSP0093-20121207/66733_1 /TAXON_ID=311494 /ORGANISM="Alexandrium monilatum, Strain CCMP3105" /LENGTH=66 /DNA_ID=CAMNT_0016607843 /DNA_START=42 /DNA_END=239 /DNA_ORIENTATION=+
MSDCSWTIATLFRLSACRSSSISAEPPSASPPALATERAASPHSAWASLSAFNALSSSLSRSTSAS